MAKTVWYTSNDLIESIKRKIAIPISQSTFTANDILSICDEEMMISQVPKVLSFHSEYFVTYKMVPLVENVSRYPIPDRAIGMKLRDVFWMDVSGNFHPMTQIEEHDRTFFQSSSTNTSNQYIHKFFIEGNDIVLAPGVGTGPQGFLLEVFYLRPNQLVKNDRAAIINTFEQTITLTNSLIHPLDTVNLALASTATTPAGYVYFTAVNTLGGVITAITPQGPLSLITSVGHQLKQGQTVAIVGSNCAPLINGTFIASVVDANTFTIPFKIATSGTTGTFTSPNQFSIGATDTITAANLSAAFNAVGVISSSSSLNNIVTLDYTNIYTQIICSNPIAFSVPTTTININFATLPNTYTDNETNITENLFLAGAVIDILQTKPGHKTYAYDVTIPKNGISGTVLTLPLSSILIPTGSVNLSQTSTTVVNAPNIQFMLAPLVPGDYICLANESIIPQIPPDLHTGLAEMASSVILSAQGDSLGLQTSLAKIQKVETNEGNLMANRSDGNPLKVVGRHSLLRSGKFNNTRRN